MAAHGARILWFVKLWGIRKCETVYSHLSYFSKIWVFCKRTQVRNSDLYNPHIFSDCRIFCMAGTSWAKNEFKFAPSRGRSNCSLFFFGCQLQSTTHCHWSLLRLNFSYLKVIHASLTHSSAELMSSMRDLGIKIGRTANDGSSSIDVIFFCHYAEAFATKFMPNMAKKVFPSWDFLLDLSTFKSDLYKFGWGHETPRLSPTSP